MQRFVGECNCKNELEDGCNELWDGCCSNELSTDTQRVWVQTHNELRSHTICTPAQ